MARPARGWHTDVRLDATVTQIDATAAVRLGGDLDAATAPGLGKQLLGLSSQGVRTVTLDLAELDFIESTGLSVLVAALKHLREQHGDLTLQSPRPSALKVLTITGLTDIFAITEPAGGRLLRVSAWS